jgi:hypothetical protein
MNERLIKYIQSDVTSIARKKYPNNERLQWIYVHGFLSAQLALAVEHDNRVLTQFKQAVQAALERK